MFKSIKTTQVVRRTCLHH